MWNKCIFYMGPSGISSAFPLMSLLPSRLWQAAADCPLMPLLPSRLWQAAADCPLMPLLHFCWWYPLMPLLLPSRLWQATADCLLHFRWWYPPMRHKRIPSAEMHQTVCCCLSPATPLLPYYTGNLSLHRMPFRWWLFADFSAARLLLTVRRNLGCLSVDGRPLLPFSC